MCCCKKCGSQNIIKAGFVKGEQKQRVWMPICTYKKQRKKSRIKINCCIVIYKWFVT